MRQVWLILLVAAGMFVASIADAQRFQVSEPGPAPIPSDFLLQDNTSILLLEDNASNLCLEVGC